MEPAYLSIYLSPRISIDLYLADSLVAFDQCVDRGAFHKRFGCETFPPFGYFVTNFGGSFTPKLVGETHPRRTIEQGGYDV